MTVKPTDHEIDPLLTAMLERLATEGPKWHEGQCDNWCMLFQSAVHMLYPPKAKRKSRARKQD